MTSLVVAFTDEDTETNGGWLGVAWMSLLRALDPGTMGGDTGDPLFLGLMLAATSAARQNELAGVNISHTAPMSGVLAVTV